MSKRISQPAFDLIVSFETGGRPYYDKLLARPSWPGGASGVTIGFGYDLGYEKGLEPDWHDYLDEDQLHRLSRTLGLTGSRAKQALSGVRDIVIPWDQAAAVFDDHTLPQEIRNTLRTYPGSADKLPPDAFGALVSLIFNRGTATDGDRRLEMRAIKTIIDESPTPATQVTLDRIAKQFRSMKRLWHNDPDSDGDLVDRREAEATLVERAQWPGIPV